MNRYFYVPVMDSRIMHDGVSLRDHLRVVDPELFDRECKMGFEMGRIHDNPIAKKKSDGDYYDKQTDEMFRERMLPRNLLLVLNEYGLSEVGSNACISSVPDEVLKPYEVDGEFVVDVYVDNIDYSVHAMNFFDVYFQNRDKLNEKPKGKIGQKIYQLFHSKSRKNS